MEISDYKVGDRVVYHIVQGLDEFWVPATVIGVGRKKRIVIRTDAYSQNKRIINVKNISKDFGLLVDYHVAGKT